MSTIRGRLAGLAALAAAAPLLVGCGADDGAADASGPVTVAAAEELAAEAAAVAEELAAAEREAAADRKAVDAADVVERDALTADSLVAALTSAMEQYETAHVEVAIGDLVSVSADVDYADADPAMRATMSMAGDDLRLVLVAGEVYVRQSGDAAYLKLDKDNPMVGPQIEELLGMGPRAAVDGLVDGVRSVELLGTEDVDGARLAHYAVEVDAAAFAQPLVADVGGLASDLPERLVMDLYLDDEDLLHRMEVEVAGMTLVIDVSKWGAPVEVKAPPASQVKSLS
ncbi:LppX_LprAFG lipoprotein [Nocardioides sp. YIM 152588]|uniref:LppX_LprAFG lipoprotein n=1 Tax=Nocardioides sp. YIM 152588 TaxID=3158259 RepID=UPI0032E50682